MKELLKKILFINLLISSNIVTAANDHEIEIKSQDLLLRYDAPASVWTEAIPIGNAYMGAMIFGGPFQDRLQLNETTLYSGDPKATFKAISVRKDFPEVSQLMAAERYSEAQELIQKNWLGRAQECYQPLGDLWIDVEHPNSGIANYQRSLDLSQGVAQVNYDVGETHFKREYFASYPDKVIVVRLSASQPGQLNCKLHFSTPTSPQRSISLKMISW